MSAIRIRNLHRSFGDVRAVNGVSFEVAKGSVCGFVGANGAGKTTTMRILATLDYPTGGSAEVLGVNLVEQPTEARKLIGWMPDHLGNYGSMTVLEYLDFYARALGFRGKERSRRVREVVEFTELEELLDRFSDRLSKGQTQRLGLGRSLLHDPEVLIMDEPAAGLDPRARLEFKNLVRILSEDGKTIFISSHILSELGEMCDSLLFIDRGRIVHHGDSESLKRRSAGRSGWAYEVRLDGDPSALEEWCLMQPGVEWGEGLRDGGRIRIEPGDAAAASDALARMVRAGLRVTEFRREEQRLEDAFVDILGELESERGGRAVPPLLPAAVRPGTEERQS
jgi:ABC-2 type transport system ATP-binding protein